MRRLFIHGILHGKLRILCSGIRGRICCCGSGVIPVTKYNIKFGFLAPTLQTEFFIGIDYGLKQVAAEDGWDYTSVSFENDSGTAVTDIENMVTSGCNVILAMVSDSSCDDALRAAQEAGTIVIECGVVTDVYDVSVNSSQYDIGTMISDMAGEWINTQLDGKANIVVYTTYQNQRYAEPWSGHSGPHQRSFAPIPTFLRSWISARTLWCWYHLHRNDDPNT